MTILSPVRRISADDDVNPILRPCNGPIAIPCIKLSCFRQSTRLPAHRHSLQSHPYLRPLGEHNRTS